VQEHWLPLLSQRYAARRWRLPSGRAVAVAALALTVLDLMRVDSTLIEMHPMPAMTPAAEWLAAQPGLWREYSPSYSLPPGDGLQHLDGVDPLQLAGPLQTIERATGVAANGYSVTVPAFCDGCDLATANANAALDATLLRMLDVKYVAAEFPITSPGFEQVQTFGRTRVYLNQQWVGRAWLEGGGTASVVSWSPNRMEVLASGPGRLVISEMAYPGWRASVDGAQAKLETAQVIFRAVELPAGEHSVVFEFWPATVLLGGALSLLGIAALGILLWRARGWS
jgi:hypothetical protein